MVREFIEGVHFSRKDKLSEVNRERYLIYLRNQYQSKAFQGGIISGASAVFLFLKSKRFSSNYTKLSKFIYSFHLFLTVHIFIFEIWSKMYTHKDKVYHLDKQILKLE